MTTRLILRNRRTRTTMKNPAVPRNGIAKPLNLGDDASSLRIVAFSDYRVQDIRLLYDFIKALNPRPDLILYGGDDVERFQPAEGINWFERLATLTTFGFCGVIGNDNQRVHRKLLCGERVYDVHKR